MVAVFLQITLQCLSMFETILNQTISYRCTPITGEKIDEEHVYRLAEVLTDSGGLEIMLQRLFNFVILRRARSTAF